MSAGNTVRKRVRIAAASALILFAPPGAWAEGKTNNRTGFDLGAWWGSFSQEGFGSQKTDLGLLPAVALQVQAGVRLGDLFFIEYAPHYFAVQKFQDNQDKRGDVLYWSALSLNLGISLPPELPLDAYIGGGYSEFGFSSGTRVDYDGWDWRLGVSMGLPGTERGTFRVKAEYRKFYPKSDETGTLPEAIVSRVGVFYLGLGYAIR